jgi:heme exporter protein C
MPELATDRESKAIPQPLAIATGLGLLFATYMIFVWAPTESTMGVLQRIFYFHMPSAVVAFVAFIVGGIAAIRYVASRESRFDDLSVACNEVGLVFAVVNLVTGMIWGKPAWGVYWAWGDARLMTALLLVLIYAGYLILRQSVNEPNQRAVVCAVVSIFGMADIPIVYMANRVWRTQHPGPVIGGGGGLDSNMWLVLLASLVAQLLVMWCLVRARRHLERLRREADGLRREVHAL